MPLPLLCLQDAGWASAAASCRLAKDMIGLLCLWLVSFVMVETSHYLILLALFRHYSYEGKLHGQEAGQGEHTANPVLCRCTPESLAPCKHLMQEEFLPVSTTLVGCRQILKVWGQASSEWEWDFRTPSPPPNTHSIDMTEPRVLDYSKKSMMERYLMY